MAIVEKITCEKTTAKEASKLKSLARWKIGQKKIRYVGWRGVCPEVIASK